MAAANSAVRPCSFAVCTFDALAINISASAEHPFHNASNKAASLFEFWPSTSA